jgi:hypothetical protein
MMIRMDREAPHERGLYFSYFNGTMRKERKFTHDYISIIADTYRPSTAKNENRTDYDHRIAPRFRGSVRIDLSLHMDADR